MNTNTATETATTDTTEDILTRWEQSEAGIAALLADLGR
jgi:hypothetical protein